MKVYVKGPGAGRESAVRTIHGAGIEVMEIIDAVSYTHLDVYKRQGLGIAIVSTSKGIMTDAKARQENVGGEVLCYIY